MKRVIFEGVDDEGRGAVATLNFDANGPRVTLVCGCGCDCIDPPQLVCDKLTCADCGAVYTQTAGDTFDEYGRPVNNA